jgi:tRNA U38,U39,U40 pseudouridine synthase TruA
VGSLSNSERKALVITVRARSFLYHQMRLMVAWLVEVGAGRRPVEETAVVLQKRTTDALKCAMAPPWGLYLAQVHYDPQCLQLSPAHAAGEADGSESGSQDGQEDSG